MSTEAKKLARMGRPPRFPDEGPRKNHSLRLKPSIDLAIREAAERNTRSLAEEMEDRINRSFEGEDEAWKVAQIAATVMAGYLADPNVGEVSWVQVVQTGRGLLAEARKQVAAERGVRPMGATE